ncbi:conserved protein, unknown function [Hepatocystis sp. ex Piliocolobus tephrosceles]|nr:conserved protein, unknown function [Hepatocystis sp. ex Piliocolobus tephrosceles]
MNSPDFSICMFCDNEGFLWMPTLLSLHKIKYLFCTEEKIKNYFIESYNLYNIKTNTNNNAVKFLEDLKDEKIDLLFLALSTNKFHELIIEYVITQKRIYNIFSTTLPTLSIQKMQHFKSLMNNFNPNLNIMYDIKKEYKHINKQFYWNIFNPLINGRVFHNLKNMMEELGDIYSVQIESTYIPFLVENEDIKNILFYRTVLIMSLIEFLFPNPKIVLGKNYSINAENLKINCLSGHVAFNNLNCYFNISVNSLSKIFSLIVYGANGFIDVSYNKEHNCFQLQRCQNHYEYPNLFAEDSQNYALSEMQYFLDAELYTNKYINTYINAMYIAICFWESDGETISVTRKQTNDNTNMVKEDSKELHNHSKKGVLTN